MRELEATAHDRFVSPYNLAIAYVNLGDIDKAFECLEEAYKTRDVWIIWLSSEPELDILRNDQRYFDLLRKTVNSKAANF